MNVQLLTIDPQLDFVRPGGALYVPGAEHDMSRLAQMVERLAPKLADIHMTLDSHRQVDISHPLWWVDRKGREPDPFTMITAQDVRDGTWSTRQPSARTRTLAYLDALEAGGRYPHLVWPDHCRIGSEGHSVDPDFLAATHHWERLRYAMADFVTKGSNPWTEHFSGVKAEVPDPADPSTQVNMGLVSTLESADVVLLAGEALSHCLLATVEDIVASFAPESVCKLVLLTDACAMIPDPPGTTLFTDKVRDFMTRMTGLGMKTSTTTEFLA